MKNIEHLRDAIRSLHDVEATHIARDRKRVVYRENLMGWDRRSVSAPQSP